MFWTRKSQMTRSFHHSVLTVFGFLKKDYGFRFGAATEYEIAANGNDCGLTWNLELERIILSIGQISTNKYLGLEYLVEYFHPRADLRFFAFRTRGLDTADFNFELETQARYVQLFCTPFLQGDFSQWPSDETIAKIAKQFRPDWYT